MTGDELCRCWACSDAADELLREPVPLDETLYASSRRTLRHPVCGGCGTPLECVRGGPLPLHKPHNASQCVLTSVMST